MEWILTSAYTFLFLALILRARIFELTGIPPFWLGGAFLLKVLSGILLGWIYTYYYTDRSTADTFKFFDDSRVMFNSLSVNPYDFIRMFSGIDSNAPELRKYYLQMDAWLNTDLLFNDNKTIIRLNTLFRFFSLGYYNVHAVFLNFLSFTGLLCLFKLFSKYYHENPKLLFLTTFLMPSVMFWGSGLLKDGLMLFVSGVSLWHFDKIISGSKRKKDISFFLLSTGILVFIKLYILVAILPGMIAWAITKNQNGRKVLFAFCISYLTWFSILFNIHHLAPEFKVSDIIYWKQKNFNALAELSGAKSVIEIPQLDYGVKSIVLNSPAAFLNALVRPLPADAHGNPLILASALENIFLITFIILAVIFRRKNPPLHSLIAFSIFFCILILTLAGLITPILGALVRYKVPVLPFLFFILLHFTDVMKVKTLLCKQKTQ